MKRIIKLGALASLAFMAVGCNNAEYNPDDLGVKAFLVESINSVGVASGNVTLSLDEGASVTLTAAVTDKAEEDVTFRLVIDKDVLDKYNEEQGTGYELLGEEFYTIGEEVTIPAGSYSADPIVLNFNPVKENMLGLPYALPLRLEKVKGGVDVTSETSAFVYAVSTVMVNELPVFDGASGLRVQDFNQTFPQFTVELKIQLSSTRNRNVDIFCCSLNETGGEVMCRLEDPQTSTDEHPAHSLVQFQGKGDYLNPSIHIETNKWQHYAYTYDGTKLTIYINGVNAGSKEIAPGVVKNGEFVFLSYGGVGGNNGYWAPGDSPWYGIKSIVTECRIWSVARTADQISKNAASVSPDSKGLEGYWRVNKKTWNEESKTFEDLTGKGHPMTATKGISRWKADIYSTDDKTSWD